MKKRSLLYITLLLIVFGSMEALSPSAGGRTPVGLQRHPMTKRDTVLYPLYAYKIKNTEATDSASRGSVIEEEEAIFEVPDSGMAESRLSPRDSLRQILDSSLWDKIDSIYLADSTAKAKAAFDAWYAGLSKDERKKYDAEQKAKRMMARADSLRLAKEKAKDIRDSIIAEKPRILETYAVSESEQYKRLLTWHLDRDFGKIRTFEYDTSFNYRFHDYPFRRNDVNATWLGVAGSPVMYYNYFNRINNEGVEFYKAQEVWSYSPSTLPHFNTKTPYTELAYFGTLFAGDEKESNNLHIFTTQNITPELNIALTYDRFGGGGMLENEETTNKTTVVQTNYLGKKYTMHAAYIYNVVSREENGGMTNIGWIRDTTVDARDIPVALSSASSKIKKNTFSLDQQLRIPFNFINKIKAGRDSTFTFDADSLIRDITTAYIGHSSEYSTYTREYSNNSTTDSMQVMKLDNKVYIRLQPWSSDAIVSKLDVGAGDILMRYFNPSSSGKETQNSFYVYAGAEGQLRNSFFWDASAEYTLLGYNFGDFRVAASGRLDLYPFRRAKKSPLSIGVNFESTLSEPTFYEQHVHSSNYDWDNDFGKISTTTLRGNINIPHWGLSADVGYALLGNNLYYGSDAVIRQNDVAMSVLSANIKKNFKLGPFHLDNRVLLQFSSNEDVLPLPMLALNLRYYFQFVVQRSEDKSRDIMTMQIGADAYCNTPWHSPAWNPELGVFHNQTDNLYTNGPFFDVFVNIQWKRAVIFVKYQNAGGGWPKTKFDYFSADKFIITQNGLSGLKIGIYWPFYMQPTGRPERID